MCRSSCWTDSTLTAVSFADSDLDPLSTIPSDADEDLVCQSQFCSCKSAFANPDPLPGNLHYSHSFNCSQDYTADADGEKSTHFPDQLAWQSSYVGQQLLTANRHTRHRMASSANTPPHLILVLLIKTLGMPASSDITSIILQSPPPERKNILVQ